MNTDLTLTSACSLVPSLNFSGPWSPRLYNGDREKPSPGGAVSNVGPNETLPFKVPYGKLAYKFFQIPLTPYHSMRGGGHL